MWLNSKKSARRLLWFICLFGFGLRLWFNLVSHHIYHPDEIFQTLEPTYRLVYGYGIIPWDYTYGLRSWLTPYFLSLPLSTLKFLHLTEPRQYIPLMKIFLSLLSLSLIPAAYLLTYKLCRRHLPALTAALITSIWYELIYFSGRAFTECLAVYLFGFSLILALKKKPQLFLAAFLMILGGLLRPQYFLVPLFALFIWVKYRSRATSSLPLFLGALTALSLYGAMDFAVLGFPFISLVNNVRLSLLSGISVSFGKEPWYFFPQALLITSGGLILLIFLNFRSKTLTGIYGLYLSLLILHSLISHKEYRFIFILIPLNLILLTLAYFHFYPKPTRRYLALSFSLIAFISLLGLMGQLPGQYRYYRFSPLARDPALSLSQQLSFKDQCALFMPDRGWVTSGGYYSLGSNLPLYTFDYLPPATASAAIILIPKDASIKYGTPLKGTPGFEYLSPQGKLKHPGYLISQVTGDCPPNLTYSFKRSFDYLEPFLKYAATY